MLPGDMTVESIDLATDPRVDDYRSLNDTAARRQIEGDELFVAEGPLAVARVLSSAHSLRSILVTERKLDRLRSDLEPYDLGDAVVYSTRPDVLREIVGFDLHRGVVAIAERRPLTRLVDLVAAPGQLHLAGLVGLNDPENVGAIARSARAFGLDGLVLDPTCTDPYARRTVRVSMGEVLHLPVVRSADWMVDLDTIMAADIETWALTPAADGDDLWELAVPDRLAVVLGAEGPGLDATTLRRCHRRVRIPIRPEVDSINVGAAAAIAFALIGR